MPITRKFIDWSQPALPAIAAELQREYTVLGQCDLSQVIAVLPGGQAGRRFQELLALCTGGQLNPPQVVTAGQLPELLYQPQRPFASSLTQQLAWGEALRSLPPEQLQVVVRQPPREAEFEGWLALGELLARQHRELAADLLSFADVAERGRTLVGFNERPRWEVLREVQQRYLARLDELQLWDQQTARLVAIEKKECATDKQIILIGTVDLNQTLRAMLDQVADRVAAYIHAPKKLQNLFDEHGCLKPAEWERAAISIQTEQVQVVEGPAEQAEAVGRALAEFGTGYAPDEITVGVPDERLVPHIRRFLHQCGVSTRWVVDRELPHTEPYLLLDAMADYLESRRTAELTALVRHPDVTEWLDYQGMPADWLTSLDEDILTHLPQRLQKCTEEETYSEAVVKLVELIDGLIAPLRSDSQPLADWSSALSELLLRIYGHREFDREVLADRSILDACRQIHQTLLDHTKIPQELQPSLRASQAIRLTLEQVSSGIIPPDAADAAVQIYGWLELPLDDSPALVVTSLNEGLVPSSVNHDMFLPNRLRTHLGLEDNSRRYARDAYALSVLSHARKTLKLIVGKRDLLGEPLVPSRLLFATDAQEVARRILTFYDNKTKAAPPRLEGPLVARHPDFQFEIPRPQPRQRQPERFRVTELSDYLKSPYRYYLRHVLRLEERSDEISELDPANFGNLIHHVLDEFGHSDVRNSSDPVAVREFLEESLQAEVTRQYGSSPLMAVHVQVEQARVRLGAFANWQAAWAAAGWELRHAEEEGYECLFPLPDGRTVKLRGRIDRVDYHPERDQWTIFDYKTGERSGDPDKTHRQKGEWVNLQLPLYRHLAAPHDVTGNVQLGFIALPRDTNDIREYLAEWTSDELREADAVAADVIQKILNEEFWVPQPDPPDVMWEMAPICQDGVFGKRDSV